MSILKDLRERQALSQQDLAGMCGVAKSTIVRIENSQHRPNWVTIRKLAGALGCDVTELVHLRQEREQQISDETPENETPEIEQRIPERHRESTLDDQREYMSRRRDAAKGTR